MLRLRVITALVLVIPFLLSLTVASLLPFALLTLVFIAAAGWEWGRLNQAPGAVSIGMAVLLALACAAAFAADWTTRTPAAAWWLACAVWLAGGFIALRSGPAQWPHLPRAARWVIGLVALWAAWLAMGRARAVGINFMLSVFCLVWMADVAAYFGGKAWGRRKLAPAISPGKSWEGVWSGMAGVLLLALLWNWIDRTFAVDGPSLYTHLARTVGLVGTVLTLLALSAMSVVGDLVESLVKRAAGMKDSSGLLPGHGGVLDRIDALLPVFPIALALAWL
jgi:phosphatidate cytidylyltransferase